MYNGNTIISMSVARPASFPERSGVVMVEFASEVLIRTTYRGIKPFLWEAARLRDWPSPFPDSRFVSMIEPPVCCYWLRRTAISPPWSTDELLPLTVAPARPWVTCKAALTSIVCTPGEAVTLIAKLQYAKVSWSTGEFDTIIRRNDLSDGSGAPSR